MLGDAAHILPDGRPARGGEEQDKEEK